MGCDIHMFVEAQNSRGKWVLVDHPDVNRNYDLFEKMAGVRGDTFNAIAQPRGLPENVSDGTKMHYDYEGEDAHTESYLNLPEIKQLEKWIEKQDSFSFCPLGYMLGNGFGLDEDSIRKADIKDIRFVFWFDN